MTRSYIFRDDDNTLWIEFRTDQLGNSKRFTVLDIVGLEEAEEKTNINFRQLPYHEDAFVDLARDEGLILDRQDKDSSTELINNYSSISIDTASISDGTQGTYKLENLDGSGGVAPYKWTLDSGSIPNGMRLTESGSLHGTPTETGTFNPTFKLEDAVGKSVTKSFTFSIA